MNNYPNRPIQASVQPCCAVLGKTAIFGEGGPVKNFGYPSAAGWSRRTPENFLKLNVKWCSLMLSEPWKFRGTFGFFRGRATRERGGPGVKWLSSG